MHAASTALKNYGNTVDTLLRKLRLVRQHISLAGFKPNHCKLADYTCQSGKSYVGYACCAVLSLFEELERVKCSKGASADGLRPM